VQKLSRRQLLSAVTVRPSSNRVSMFRKLGLASLVLGVTLLAGCSAPSSAGYAKEICDARFTLINVDPDTDAGAEQWVKYYLLAGELRGFPEVTESEKSVAVSMDLWFNRMYEAVQAGGQWPLLGAEYVDAGLELSQVCIPFD